jgi:hypothetical protein
MHLCLNCTGGATARCQRRTASAHCRGGKLVHARLTREVCKMLACGLGKQRGLRVSVNPMTLSTSTGLNSVKQFA